jgi:hypothetical protein
MIPIERPSAEERRLLRLLRRLSAGDRSTVLAFAEFLAARGVEGVEDREAAAAEPVHEPRPDDETVIAAIKRLRRTYPMLESDEMLNETSGLMAEHVLHGRPAREVIDALEALFASRHRAAQGGDAAGSQGSGGDDAGAATR